MTSHMLREIRSQPEAWASAADAVASLAPGAVQGLRGAPRAVTLLGAGSSYYLSVAARTAWARRGFLAAAVPSSEQLLHPEAYRLPEGGLAVGISRSGTTSETLAALRMLREGGAQTIGITTEPGTPIQEVSDVLLAIPGAAETSTVQTRSFSSQLLAAVALSAVATEGAEALLREQRTLPIRGAALITEAEALVGRWATGIDRIYVLGSGALWGLAMEGALKLKETSLSEAEAFQTLEFRHGPQSMVDGRTLVVGLLGDDPRGTERRVLDEMAGLGAEVLAVEERAPRGAGRLTSLALESGVSPEARLPLYLPVLQLLAHARGSAKGLDPDHPRNLRFAIELEGL